ncbi:hypothetical protein AWN68_09115 [Roseivirga echinicomitans]|uniref:Uncharacterized protein n=2 Tax=Roseivirga echinicomitans TaxID=296218 RepID=A0A150X2A0_9BACT|nr:hypothetical protein AWN68_09115 [Roseivirga echinicomitans]
MIAMEFKEMKKIWDTQNDEALYVINEDALHRRIKAKKMGTKRKTSFSEVILIVSNLCAGGVVIISHLLKNSGNVAALSMGAMMMIVGAYILFMRSQRIKRDQQTDVSILGDLENAIENINYRIKLSQSMIWFCLIVIAFTMYTVLNSDKSLLNIILISGFFIIGFFMSRWEHKRFNLGKKKQLLDLKEKLINEFEM